MKKKIPALLLLIVMVAGLFTVTASAERKEGLPINLKDSSMWIELTINSFEVTGAENIPGRYLNRVHYHMTHTPGYSWTVAFICYNSSGIPLGTVTTTLGYYDTETLGYVDVWDTTATIEIAAVNPVMDSQSYLYRNYVNVYSLDGRAMGITDLQVPVYRLVGWELPVTMYAFEYGNFNRTIEVHPGNVAAYKNVGWYTKEDVDNAVTMYAPGSRKMRVPADQVWLYRKVGWNTKKVVSTDSWRNMNIRVAGYRKFNDDPLNYEFAMGARKFTEDYGTKVTFMVGGGDGMGEDLVAAIVSGKPWDIQYAFGISVFPMAFEEGLYTPITEYIDFNDEGVDEITANGAKWKGEYYGISCLPMQEIHYMAYNETWMKRLGLKTPYEYYKEGNWNLDTYKVLNEKATALGAPIRSSYTRPHTTTMYMTSWDETRGRVTVTYDSPENHRWLSYWASLLTDRRYNIKGGGFVSKRNSIMRDEVMPNLMKDELTQYTNDVIRYIHYPNMDGGTGSYLTDSHFVFPVGVKGDRLACAVKLASYMSAEKGKISLDNYRTYMNSADFELFKKNMNDAYYLPRIFYSGAFASGSVFRNDIARGKSVATHIAEQTRILNVEASEYNRKYAD